MSLSLTSRATGSLSGKLKLTVATLALAPAIIATPSLAQKGPAGAEVIEEGYSLCLDAVDNFDDVAGVLTAAGWTIDEQSNYGPYQNYINASKLGDAAVGDKYFYATIEHYPSRDLVYCTYEIEGPYATPNYEFFNNIDGMVGEYQNLPEGTYGTWEWLAEGVDELWLMQAEPEYFYLQLDWVGPGSGAAPGNGGK